MNDQILPRAQIAQSAGTAAMHWVEQCRGKVESEWPAKPANPHAGEAREVWQAAFERYLVYHSAPEGEGSA